MASRERWMAAREHKKAAGQANRPLGTQDNRAGRLKTRRGAPELDAGALTRGSLTSEVRQEDGTGGRPPGVAVFAGFLPQAPASPCPRVGGRLDRHAHRRQAFEELLGPVGLDALEPPREVVRGRLAQLGQEIPGGDDAARQVLGKRRWTGRGAGGSLQDSQGQDLILRPRDTALLSSTWNAYRPVYRSSRVLFYALG